MMARMDVLGPYTSLQIRKYVQYVHTITANAKVADMKFGASKYLTSLQICLQTYVYE